MFIRSNHHKQMTCGIMHDDAKREWSLRVADND